MKNEWTNHQLIETTFMNKTLHKNTPVTTTSFTKILNHYHRYFLTTNVLCGLHPHALMSSKRMMEMLRSGFLRVVRNENSDGCFFLIFWGTKVWIKMLNGRGGTGGCHPSLFSHKSIVQTPHFLFFFFLSFTTQSQTAKRWVSDRSRPQMERDTERKK